jgi:hypothetical protein
VPRPERPIDPDWPLAELAGGLRDMRRKCNITYREMARMTNYGKTVLSAAADGRSLPTWEVVKAYVLACGGSLDEWEHRWSHACDILHGGENGEPDE